MSISSLVIDVSGDAIGQEALQAIAADARFTMGPANGTRHAIVLDTASMLDDAPAFDWLRDLPGVRLVTLVSAYLDDEPLPEGVAASYL